MAKQWQIEQQPRSYNNTGNYAGSSRQENEHLLSDPSLHHHQQHQQQQQLQQEDQHHQQNHHHQQQQQRFGDSLTAEDSSFSSARQQQQMQTKAVYEQLLPPPRRSSSFTHLSYPSALMTTLTANDIFKSRSHGNIQSPNSFRKSPVPIREDNATAGEMQELHGHHHSQAPSDATIIDEPRMFTCFKAGRNTHVILNLINLGAGLIVLCIGILLMGFYRLHMLDVITIEFMLVPVLMVLGGCLTICTALFGLFVLVKRDSCLMTTYSCFLAVQFLILLVAVILSIKLDFDILTRAFDVDVIPELSLYETDPYIKYKWDTLQWEFTCCGGYGYNLGYIDWKHTPLGGAQNSVPDSCCLVYSTNCGRNIYDINDLRVIIQRINLNGCITTILDRRLKNHVLVILIVFAICGGILALVQLLGIVLACCMASQMAKEENTEWENDYFDEQEKRSKKGRRMSGGSGGPELTSLHETSI